MRVMAIDYGDAHTGVALSDPTGFLVGFTTTINSWRQEVVLDRLLRLIEEHRPDEVVLGFPKNMDGTDGRKADLYRDLAARLEEAGLPAKTVLVNCGEGFVPHGAAALLKRDLSLDGAGLAKKALEVLGRGETAS